MEDSDQDYSSVRTECSKNDLNISHEPWFEQQFKEVISLAERTVSKGIDWITKENFWESLMRVIGFFTIHLRVNKDIENETTLYNSFIKQMTPIIIERLEFEKQMYEEDKMNKVSYRYPKMSFVIDSITPDAQIIIHNEPHNMVEHIPPDEDMENSMMIHRRWSLSVRLALFTTK